MEGVSEDTEGCHLTGILVTFLLMPDLQAGVMMGSVCLGYGPRRSLCPQNFAVKENLTLFFNFILFWNARDRSNFYCRVISTANGANSFS